MEEQDLRTLKRNGKVIRVLNLIATGIAGSISEACEMASVPRSTFYVSCRDGSIDELHTLWLKRQGQIIKVLKHLALTGSVSEACRSAGVPRSTFYSWVDEGYIEPELAGDVIEDILDGIAERAADQTGHVYVLKADNGLYKIGRTRRLPIRLHRLCVQLPYDLELVWSTETEDAPELERTLHGRFAHRHVRGEWYALTEADLEILLIHF